MKRKAEEEADEVFAPLKRQQITVPIKEADLSYPPPALAPNSLTTSIKDNNTNANTNDNDTSPQNAHTLTPTATTVPGSPPPAAPANSLPTSNHPCTYPGCAKTFNRPARLAAHLRSHTNDRAHKCPYPGCDKTYLEEKHLAQHVKGSHTHEKKYVCEEEGCGKAFVTATRLRRHAAVHEGRERFRCRGYEGCEVSFRKHQTLQRHGHMRKEHVDCVFCEVRCSSQAELERHVDMYHSGTTVEDRKTVECTWDGCGKKFTRVSNLNTHVRTVHEGLRYVCGEFDTFDTEDIADWNWMEEGCAQSFISRMKLEEHIRYVHLGRKRPPKLHTIKSALPGEADEMSAAVPTRTIPCSVDGCPAMFARNHDLEKHVEKDHYVLREGEDAIDPALEGPSEPASQSEPFWIESVVPAVDEPSFDSEWAEMRRLIDLDALVCPKE
ncbi:hypothetical protein N0V88_005921 [Collariella sp. IMI 366227]|nr:hypothetical protein N0V88_005921 [Collariella sp. IMI 366227]